MNIESGDLVKYLPWESEDERVHKVHATLSDDDGSFIMLSMHPADAPEGYRYDGIWGGWGINGCWLDSNRFELIKSKKDLTRKE